MTGETRTSLVRPDSLGDTLDAVNAALFYEQPIGAEDRAAVVDWIADRQGLPGAYAGMFAPTGYDYSLGALTFTGEPIRSGAATGHILSEEACRALYRLEAGSPQATHALDRARKGIIRRLKESEVQGEWSGVYCCGTCTASLWRHLSVSGEPGDVIRLEQGLSELRRLRDGKGRWKRFPFYYTLLALYDIDLPAAREEYHYAQEVMERSLRRLERADLDEESEHDRRRRILMERIFERW